MRVGGDRRTVTEREVNTCNSPRRSWIEDWLFLMRKKMEPKIRALKLHTGILMSKLSRPPVPLSEHISNLWVLCTHSPADVSHGAGDNRCLVPDHLPPAADQ